jgi:hypothetical protein
MLKIIKKEINKGKKYALGMCEIRYRNDSDFNESSKHFPPIFIDYRTKRVSAYLAIISRKT